MLADIERGRIFVDTNIPMYLVGAPHPNRERAAVLPRNRPGGHYVTSAEVYQEILHRLHFDQPAGGRQRRFQTA